MFDIGFKFIKVASFDCASHKLIEEICKKKFDHLLYQQERLTIERLKKQFQL